MSNNYYCHRPAN